MTRNWFVNCQTVNEVKAEYKALCFRYHPDVSGGDTTATMQDINAAYLVALKSKDGEVSRGFDGKDHTYKYNRAREVGAIETINALVAAGFSEAVTIELLGSWVWLSGVKYGSDDQKKLKSLKHPTRIKKDGKPAALMSWHSRRKLYYWRPDDARSYYNARASFEDLRASFGALNFDERETRGGNRGNKAAQMIGAH